MNRKPIFDAVSGLVPGIWNIPGTVERMDAVLDLVPEGKVSDLTERTVIEIVEHEAIVLEAYKDSANVWTWSVGITSASGHDVARYKDNPQTLEHCLEVYIWLLREKYLPPVLKAFEGCDLAEHQLAAALSFHWNTGAIERTDWVKLFKAGKSAEARQFLLTHYLNGGDLTARRKAEAALFFDGKWIGDGKVVVWPVKKPSYAPNWSKPQVMDIRSAVKEAMNA
jgi:GH24 family phage-related lysozyme (muramidase)